MPSEIFPPLLDPSRRNALRRSLLAWYRAVARDLPWRRTRDPYAIWVSEIMLQQTQVETVVPYYRRFLQALPTVAALAAAPEGRVMKLWEGLGYYRRARHLHAAARRVMGPGHGVLPADARAWQELPGVGAYTAGAIASIALGEPAAILDGNVKRVLSRLFVVSGQVERTATQARLWALARALVPARSPGDFNQALMELGAVICREDAPRCGVCPVKKICRAYASGDPERWPKRAPGKPKPHRIMVAGWLTDGDKILLGQRPEGGLLGGLWEIPGGVVKAGEVLPGALRRVFREKLGLSVKVGEELAAIGHAYTHVSLTLHVLRVLDCGGIPRPRFHQALCWAGKAARAHLALSRADRKVLEKLAKT